jgi:hypothetical protein
MAKDNGWYWCSLSLTLKAFANSSPGLRFGNPGNTRHLQKTQTLKGLSRRSPKTVSTPSELRQKQTCILSPGFQSKPWAGIGQRLQR